MSWKPEIEELHRRERLAHRMGGPEKVEKQHFYGKLTIRERIQEIADRDSFHEIGALAESFRNLITYLKEQASAASALGRGDLSFEVRARSDQDQLSHAMISTTGALKGLVNDTGKLVAACRSGDLQSRGDAAKFEGAYAELVSGINEMVDACPERLWRGPCPPSPTQP